MFSKARSQTTLFLLWGVVFMMAFGIMVPALHVVHAQPQPPGAGPGGTLPGSAPTGIGPAPVPGIPPADDVSQANRVDYADQKYQELSCSIYSLATEGLRLCIALVANTIMGMTANLLSIAGRSFNWAISETVVRMGRNVDGLIGLNRAWEVMRDFGNLIFVFALILIGIATILRAGSYHYKNLLKSVIIGALLINFSLVIGKVIIDASNILATEIYRTLMVSSPDCQPANLETAAGKEACANNGLSGLITSRLRITSIHSVTKTQGIFGGTLPEGSGGGGLTDAMKIIIVASAGSIFILITTIVIFGGTIMLVIRFIVLIFLLAFSPVAFAGMALPYTQRYAKMWWNKLLSQAFFAPAYLLMIYISITMMETPLIDGATQGTFADALLNYQGASGIIFMFMLVIGLMILSLIVATQLGAYGASGTLNVVKGFGNYLKGAAGSATFGGVAALGRATIGRDAYNENQLRELNERASGKGVGAYAARLQLRANNYASTASFDARRAGSLGKQLQSAGLGKGKEGGFKKQVEEKKKQYEAMASQIGKDHYSAKDLEDIAVFQKGRRDAENDIYRLQQQSIGAEARGESPAVYKAEIERLAGEVKKYDVSISEIDKRAKEIGKANKQQYARSIQDEKVMAFITGTGNARAEAAAAIRKGDTKAKDLKDAFKKFGIKIDDDEDDKKKDDKPKEEKPKEEKTA